MPKSIPGRTTQLRLDLLNSGKTSPRPGLAESELVSRMDCARVGLLPAQSDPHPPDVDPPTRAGTPAPRFHALFEMVGETGRNMGDGGWMQPRSGVTHDAAAQSQIDGTWTGCRYLKAQVDLRSKGDVRRNRAQCALSVARTCPCNYNFRRTCVNGGKTMPPRRLPRKQSHNTWPRWSLTLLEIPFPFLHVSSPIFRSIASQLRKDATFPSFTTIRPQNTPDNSNGRRNSGFPRTRVDKKGG